MVGPVFACVNGLEGTTLFKKIPRDHRFINACSLFFPSRLCRDALSLADGFVLFPEWFAQGTGCNKTNLAEYHAAHCQTKSAARSYVIFLHADQGPQGRQSNVVSKRVLTRHLSLSLPLASVQSRRGSQARSFDGKDVALVKSHNTGCQAKLQ